MPNQLPPSIFPARFQILSGSMLKLLACIAMLIDHTGAIILSHYPPRSRSSFISMEKELLSIVLSAILDDVLFLFSVF